MNNCKWYVYEMRALQNEGNVPILQPMGEWDFGCQFLSVYVLDVRHRVAPVHGVQLCWNLSEQFSFTINHRNSISCSSAPWCSSQLYEGVSKSFRTESITKSTTTKINTRWEATQRVMATKLTRLTHKIAIQLYLVVPGGQSGNFWILPQMLTAMCCI
jgi:hypothetical protein